MAKKQESSLMFPEFWSRMEKNSLFVQRMPGWMKGSPINKRTLIVNKVTNQRMSVKPAPLSNR